MKVLVIEDEHRIATYIKKGLELKSFTVDVAYDGQEGYDLASSESYDVIILDRMLPRMDGVSVCKNLRAEGIHTPILMLTAKVEVADRVEGLDSGADDYLPKPFAFSELLSRLRALSRRPRVMEEAVYKADDLEVNAIRYEVKRAGKKIELSKKEFSLLEYLIRHQGKVVSSEQIIEQVWSYDSDVLPNTAQVYIGYLRNKIDKPFSKSKQLIKTVRGFGYKLDSGT